MIGTKGVPAKWGGIEKYVEEVGQRLAARGHEVTVFGSRWFLKDYTHNTYKGMKIRRVPTIQNQATDAMSNVFFSAAIATMSQYDIVNLHGYASYYFIPLLHLGGKTTVVTAHGIESGWDNPKYGNFAKRTIMTAFSLGIKKADMVATVAEHLKTRIRETYQRDSHVLASGIDDVSPQPPMLITEKYKLKGDDYVLFLGRIDPIKRVDWLLDLGRLLDDRVKVVIAGGAQNTVTKEYFESLKQKSGGGSQIIFTGPVYGDEKTELLSNCLMFMAPSRDEGLPITLLEALSFDRCCVASDIPAHREVVKDGITGFLFQKEDKDAFLQTILHVMRDLQNRKRTIDHNEKMKTFERFNWERTTLETEKLFLSALDKTDAN